jgi:hypothetical protein
MTNTNPKNPKLLVLLLLYAYTDIIISVTTVQYYPYNGGYKITKKTGSIYKSNHWIITQR